MLVGLNGAGETTLIKLLMRLYDPTEGVILLDGHDIKEYDVKALYDMFGIVFQDYGKYAVTVRENIAFGEVMKDIVEEEIEQAAAYNNAQSFIEKLPQNTTHLSCGILMTAALSFLWVNGRKSR